MFKQDCCDSKTIYFCRYCKNKTCMYQNSHKQHVHVLQFTWTTRVWTTIYLNSTCMYYNVHEQHVYVHVLQYTSTARVCTTMYMINTRIYYNSHEQHVYVLQFTWLARISTTIYMNKTCLCLNIIQIQCFETAVYVFVKCRQPHMALLVL